MIDKSEELLSGKDALRAFLHCFKCMNLEPCETNHWAITTDKDGKTCDNYKSINKGLKEL